MALFVGWLQEDPAKQATVALAAVLFMFVGAAVLFLRAATFLPRGVRPAISAAVLAGVFALGTRPDDWIDFAAAFFLGLIGLVLFSGLAIGLVLLWIWFVWRGG